MPSRSCSYASLELPPYYFSSCLDYFMLVSLTSLIVNSSGVEATGLGDDDEAAAATTTATTTTNTMPAATEQISK